MAGVVVSANKAPPSADSILFLGCLSFIKLKPCNTRIVQDCEGEALQILAGEPAWYRWQENVHRPETRVNTCPLPQQREMPGHRPGGEARPP